MQKLRLKEREMKLKMNQLLQHSSGEIRGMIIGKNHMTLRISIGPSQSLDGTGQLQKGDR